MPRPRRPNAKDRSRKPVDVPTVLVRRTTLARAVDCTEGFIRMLNDRGTGPTPIRIEGSRLVLYDFAEAISWFKRNASTPAA